MKKFTIDATVPCFVTWRYEIEANSEAEAIAIYNRHETEPVNSASPFIGDAIGGEIAEFVVQP